MKSFGNEILKEVDEINGSILANTSITLTTQACTPTAIQKCDKKSGGITCISTIFLRTGDKAILQDREASEEQPQNGTSTEASSLIRDFNLEAKLNSSRHGSNSHSLGN